MQLYWSVSAYDGTDCTVFGYVLLTFRNEIKVLSGPCDLRDLKRNFPFLGETPLLKCQSALP